jgi:hypothetical protein
MLLRGRLRLGAGSPWWWLVGVVAVLALAAVPGVALAQPPDCVVTNVDTDASYGTLQSAVTGADNGTP